MLRFRLDLSKYNFAKGVPQSVIDDFLRTELTEAARAFFHAALPLVQLDNGAVRPYSTGMSIASFTNLAKFLDEPFDYYVTRAPQPGGYRPPDSGVVLDKSPDNGEQMATEPGDILKFKGSTLNFQYWTEVWQFVLWDTVGLPRGTRGPTGAPWGAFEAGRAAALQYLSTSTERFPKLETFFPKTGVQILVQDGVTRAKYKT